MEISKISRHASRSAAVVAVWLLGKRQYTGILHPKIGINGIYQFLTIMIWSQAGEMAHKAHVKEAMLSTNRKDWEIQIMSVHARQDAIVHHTEMMIGNFIFI